MLACALPLVAAVGSTASAETCADLREQLRRASQVGNGARSQARRYAEAAIRQREELDKTLSIRSRQGCDSRFSAECRSLDNTIRQMRINLDALQRQRDRLSGNRNAALIRAIETRLEDSRCDEPRLARNEPQSRGVTVIAPTPDESPRKSRIIVREGVGRQRLFEPKTGGVSPLPDVAGSDSPAITLPYMAGSFRTLCVRTCDGYYFPISFSTAFDYLERDAQACAAMCPATEARLYFHRVPEQESEDMISLRGEPYSALPNAFLYRRQRTDEADPSCGCDERREANMSVANRLDDPGRSGTIPPTASEPATGEDEALQATSPEDIQEEADLASKPVRVVGPVFLPAPEEAIDLQSPDRTSDR